MIRVEAKPMSTPSPSILQLMLKGRGGMPLFTDMLTAEQMAAVATYIRSRFNNYPDPVTVEDSLWADGQGRPLGTRQLVVTAKISRSGETFSWLLKKMR